MLSFPLNRLEVCNTQSGHSQKTFHFSMGVDMTKFSRLSLVMEKKEPKKHGFTPHGFTLPVKGLCIITILIASEKVLHKILESSSDFKSVVEMAFPFVSSFLWERSEVNPEVKNSSTEQNDIKQRLKPLSGSH